MTIKTNNLTQTSLTTGCNLKSIHYFVCFPARAEMYSIQHYVIKFVSDMWQVGGFLWLLRFPPPTKLIAEILLKVALNTITLTLCVFILKCVYSNNVGFTTTYAISAYHHWCCEFESDQGEVYSIQHYVIKFVSDFLETGQWFSPGPPVSSTNKTDCHDIAEILLKVTLNTIKPTNHQIMCLTEWCGCFIYFSRLIKQESTINHLCYFS